MNLHWHITQSPYFTSGFTLAVVQSMGFDMSVTTCIHQSSFIQNSFPTSHRLNICLRSHPPPPTPANAYVKCWPPNVMVFGSGVLGRWLGRALMNGISVFIKEVPCPLPPCENTAHTQLSMNRKAGSHQVTGLLAPWSWTSLPPELWKVIFCCV